MLVSAHASKIWVHDLIGHRPPPQRMMTSNAREVDVVCEPTRHLLRKRSGRGADSRPFLPLGPVCLCAGRLPPTHAHHLSTPTASLATQRRGGPAAFCDGVLASCPLTSGSGAGALGHTWWWEGASPPWCTSSVCGCVCPRLHHHGAVSHSLHTPHTPRKVIARRRVTPLRLENHNSHAPPPPDPTAQTPGAVRASKQTPVVCPLPTLPTMPFGCEGGWGGGALVPPWPSGAEKENLLVRACAPLAAHPPCTATTSTHTPNTHNTYNNTISTAAPRHPPNLRCPTHTDSPSPPSPPSLPPPTANNNKQTRKHGLPARPGLGLGPGLPFQRRQP